MIFEINLGEYINSFLQESGYQVNPVIGQCIAAFIFFALTFIIGWVIYHVFTFYFTRWAKKTKTTLDDEIIKNVKRPLYFLVILVGFWIAVDQLIFLDIYTVYIGYIFIAAEVFLIAYIITRVINVLASWYARRVAQKKNRK